MHTHPHLIKQTLVPRLINEINKRTQSNSEKLSNSDKLTYTRCQRWRAVIASPAPPMAQCWSRWSRWKWAIRWPRDWEMAWSSVKWVRWRKPASRVKKPDSPLRIRLSEPHIDRVGKVIGNRLQTPAFSQAECHSWDCQSLPQHHNRTIQPYQ